jgi:hypothetical protein
LSCVIIVSTAQCVQQNLTASYAHANEGTALVTTHIQQLLRLRTTGDTAAPAVLLHGAMLKEQEKGTLSSQMANVK